MAFILNRRSFVQKMTGAAMLPMALRTMTCEAAKASTTPTILVVIELNGGNDGLNTIVPLNQYGAYSALRPSIGFPESHLTLTFNQSPGAIGSGSQYAFNPAMGQNLQVGGSPAMPGLPAAYANGNLAIVVGTGLPDSDPQRDNHPCARADWYIGQPEGWSTGQYGWLGLALDNGVYGALGPSLSMADDTALLYGKKAKGITVGQNIRNFQMSYPWGINNQSMSAWLTDSTNNSAASKFSLSVTQETLAAVQAVGPIVSSVNISDYVYMNGGGTGLEQQLASVAQLIRGQSGVLGYFTSFGNFDTHSDQLGEHANLLSTLSGAMANFYNYLKKYNVSSNVVIMTISDFGRTAQDNTGFGTDHGTAGVSFILGDKILGGVYGDYPSLTSLDQYQMAITVPFQNVISDIINGIGGNANQILGTNYARLGFI
jgi:uncharacterized protein (DUF1501 family)